MAAVLAGGKGAALSHRSAADLWGLRRNSTYLEVTVPRPRVGRPGLVFHRSRMMEPIDFTSIGGIPITTVARTLLDMAAISTRTELEYLIDRSERLNLFDLTAVEDMLERANGRKGRRKLRRAIAAWHPSRTKSKMEDRFQGLLARSRLPQSQINAVVTGERLRHEVDCYWPDSQLVVELDSFGFHRTRRDLERDAERNADLELVGIRIVRLSWNDITIRGDGTLRRLEKLLLAKTNHPGGRS